MTDAVVNGKETRCLFINNGDDLLTLKKVVSKKSDKDDVEKQKNHKTKEVNGSELNGNHNKTDSINFDVDNTSSLEPNLEMDSDTDRNITIDDSICTQEDRELENIDVSNENSNETDAKNDDKDNQAMTIKNLDIEYSPSNSLDDLEYSCELEDDDLENIKSPTSAASYFNISSRAPLHTDIASDTTIEDILPLNSQILFNEKKRKSENLPEYEQKPSKIRKLWNIMKYPFQKVTTGTTSLEYGLNISKADVVTEEEKPVKIVPENSNEIEEIDQLVDNEKEEEIEDVSENVNKQKFCSIM